MTARFSKTATLGKSSLLSKSPQTITRKAKKKTAEPNLDAEEPLTDDQKVIFLTRQIEALKHNLVYQTNKATDAENEVRELRARVVELMKDNEAEKQKAYEITAAMTLQHKALKEEHVKMISKLQADNLLLEQKLKEAENERVKVAHQKDQIIESKIAELKEKNAKMDEMAYEFGTMLKETLDKMNEKVATTKEWNGDLATPYVRSIEDFSLSKMPSFTGISRS
eukprot:TRINITY_DN712_c0_g1_i4.p1 TRINITY_DN712_c0_g1~~TRINITY_DN712_c0_g1_i4.p1  ORF type:complete len:240 (-),score=71.46 TRINITY_DN712_c0_g1_i4:488-1159(-)